MARNPLYISLGVSTRVLLSTEALFEFGRADIFQHDSLFTGAAAAESHPVRQYLVARLIQFGFSIGLEQHEDFQSRLS